MLGRWLHTATRALLYADTGLGKTMLAMGIAVASATGGKFLHWQGSGKLRSVLFVDGEMSLRLFRDRIVGEVHRACVENCEALGLHALSHEDIADFVPLNTEPGQQFIDELIAELGVEFIGVESAR
jgi:hypothetical protein